MIRAWNLSYCLEHPVANFTTRSPVATTVAMQPGFAGCLILELVNAGSLPIRLRPGLRVAQLQVWSSKTATDSPYATGFEKYRAPLGPESSRLAWESNELNRIRRIGAKLLGN
jgi:dCTP deaminase